MRGGICALPERRRTRHSRLRVWWRVARTGLHVLEGWIVVTAVFPLVGAGGRAALVRSWFKRLLAIYAIEPTIAGGVPAARSALIVANHVSWLDIAVLNAVLPARFVAKLEVRSWPLIGALARRAGTLFIRRGCVSDARRVGEQVSEALLRGERIAVFPEGTSTSGDCVLPFSSSLFQPAVTARAMVQPVAIRYRANDDTRCDAAAYYGERSFVGSLIAICAAEPFRAQLVFCDPITASTADRRALALEAHAAIRATLDVPPPQLAAHTVDPNGSRAARKFHLRATVR